MQLLRSSTNWLTAGAVAGTGLLSVGVAMSLPGRSASTSATAPSSGAVSSVASGATSRTAISGSAGSGSAACGATTPSGLSPLSGSQILGSGSGVTPAYSGAYRSDDGHSEGGHDGFGGGDGLRRASDSAFLGAPTTPIPTSKIASGATLLAACVPSQSSQPATPQVVAPQPAARAPIVSSGGS
jgi:hypothetical protein